MFRTKYTSTIRNAIKHSCTNLQERNCERWKEEHSGRKPSHKINIKIEESSGRRWRSVDKEDYNPAHAHIQQAPIESVEPAWTSLPAFTTKAGICPATQKFPLKGGDEENGGINNSDNNTHNHRS